MLPAKAKEEYQSALSYLRSLTKYFDEKERHYKEIKDELLKNHDALQRILKSMVAQNMIEEEIKKKRKNDN